MTGMPHYFLHIPKTAGTSTIDWLRRSGRFNVCPHGIWSLLLEEDRGSLARYNLFCGHFYRYLEQYLRTPLSTFTFVRHPVGRAYSHYRHVLRDPYHYFHQRTQGASFLQFMQDPVTRPLISDFQTRALSATFDPAQVDVSPERRAAHPRWLEQHLETAASGLSAADELVLAKDFLDRCVFVGIAERMDESMRVLSRTLDVALDKPVSRLNVDDARPHGGWSAEESRLAVALNRQDLALYEHALGIFERRRVALVGLHEHADEP